MKITPASLSVSLALHFAVGCVPVETPVLTRSGDAGADVNAPDVPAAQDVLDVSKPLDDASLSVDVEDAATADVRPDTDEVWPSRTIRAPVGCDVGQWCWEYPRPQGESVFDATAISATDVWAVGGHGLAMRWNGSSWTRVDTGTTASLWRVWASGPSDVWATTSEYIDAGRSRTRLGLIRWDGTRWSPVTLPTGVRPSRVHGSGPRDVWVLSQPETATATPLWHYDGTRWTEANDGLPARGVAVRDLWVERAGRVWMYVGVPGEAHAYDVYRYDGARWSPLGSINSTLSSHALSGRIAGAGGEVYVLATGLGGVNTWYFANVSQTPFRYERQTTPQSSFDRSMMSAGGALWFVGTDVLRRNGGAWASTSLPRFTNTRVRLPTALAASDPNNAWGFNVYGDLYRMTEGRWALVTPEDKPEFSGLSGRSGVPVAYGSSIFARAVDGAWSRAPLDVADVKQVVHDGTGAVRWVVTTQGRALRVESSRATDATPPGVTVSEMWMPDATNAWAVGGARLMRWDGTRWADAPALPATIGTVDGSRVELLHVWADGRDVWAGGGMRRVELEGDYNGVLCRLRDDSWTCVDLSTMRYEVTPVEALWGASMGDLWMLVARRLVRVDRETLARTSVGLSTGAAYFGRLVGNERTGDLALLGGVGVTVLRAAARTAEEYAAPVSGYAGGLNAAFPADDGGLWATGAHGALLRYRAR